MNVRAVRRIRRTPRVVAWAIAFAISIVVMLVGGGIILWNVSSDIPSPSAASFGATLLVLGGMKVAITGVGAWLASQQSHRER
jgi:hypothetical protein